MLLPASASARPFSTGFSDDVYFDADQAVRGQWLGRSKEAGASIVRLGLSWGGIAPQSPPADASDPGSPGYRWEQLDSAVRDASAQGLKILLTVEFAPTWAEGPGRPQSALPGSWRPDPGQLARFMTAAARRYSGSYPDPARPGSSLPAVRDWQIWNEANLSRYLSPQGGGRGAEHYRKMLNASYDALKSVSRSNLVISTGTAPFGGRVGAQQRTAPARFLRDLLCLSAALKPRRCADKARLDAIAHHPYSVRGPDGTALNRDDVSVADLDKLVKPLRAAERAHTVLPRGRKRLWITEISWDSRPPDPNGVPEKKHARWLAEAFHAFWKAGADTVIWFQVRDPQTTDFSASNESGVYLRDGTPKLAMKAARFPFVARRSGGRLKAWGRAPVRGKVTIERRSGAGWRRVAGARTDGSGVFTRVLKLPPGATLRAKAGSETSLPYKND